MNKKYLLLSVAFLIFAAGCSIMPEKADPFTQIPAEKVETIYGEIFPFSVSVSTKATHRLENENKLVSLIASDIVRLEEFEGRIVEVDGVYKKEKMRPIFWVEAIRVKNLGSNPAKLSNRFESTNYSFVIPENWESSTLEDGAVHFIDKKDTNRKVFLTFAVRDVSSFDRKNDPNIVMANMAGHKNSSSFDGGQIRQEITLFSNIFDKKKYVFVFNNNEEDFSRKKDFFKLLNSFIEGEDNVKIAHEEELKKLAAAELKLVQRDKPVEADDEGITEENDEDGGSIISRIFGTDDDEEQTIDAVANAEEEIVVEKPAKLSTEFENLIDNRSYYYESDYYRFSIKVPYGLWFQNFGPIGKYTTQVGFAKYQLGGRASSQIFLNIIADDAPITAFSESQEDGQLLIQFPRNDKSYFELRGAVEHRDYMRSIHSQLKTW